MSSTRKRGAKSVSPRDWIFGSRPRRLALRFVLDSDPPADGWSKSQLAVHAEVSPNGGIDEHVRGLLDLGLLVPVDDDAARVRYTRAEPNNRLEAPLRTLLDLLDSLPDTPLGR